MMKAVVFGIVSIFLILPMIGVVAATPGDTKYSLQELTEQATMVITGTVEDTKSEWNEDETQIYTYITISVDEFVKGAVPDERVTIKQIGGTVDDITLYIVDSPQFRVGEEVLLFVRPGLIPVVGMSQGKFTIETEPETGIKIVKEQNVYLDGFLNQVKNVEQGGEDERRSYLNSDTDTSEVGILSPGPDPFRIFGPNPGAAGDIIRELDPTDHSPFVHWDLREFPDCKVPWSISRFVSDLDEDGDIDGDDRQLTFDAINASFHEWENVTPSAIGFVEGNPRHVANRAIRLDSFNVIDWANATEVTGDDVQVIPVGQGQPNSVIITAGTNNLLNTTPASDDQVVGKTITSGANGIANTAAGGDDLQVIPVGQGQPNSIAITAGANGLLECQPRGDDALDLANHRITSGPDGVVQTQANNQYETNYVALTGIFFNNNNGVIIESDILFNSNLNWTMGTENESLGMYDVQVTATHEIGHFIGIALTPAGVGPPVPTMNGNDWPHDLSKRTLEDSDKNAINFLYTPDLGDAPDPYTGFNKYPSLVHDGTGRTLSGVPLLKSAQGAEHLFGYQPEGYAYEWLGDLVEAPADTSECEAKVVDRDEHDDGVSFVGFTPMGGAKFKVIAKVSTSGLGAARYKADDKLYLNAWVDWNADGVWTTYEKIIEWNGGPGLNDGCTKGTLLNPATPWPVGTTARNLEFEVTVPYVTVPEDRLYKPFYSRFRLDYDENVGTVNNIDGTLNQDKGAAQFGEVEDYRHVPPTEVPTLTPIGCILTLLAILGFGVIAIRRTYKR